MPTATKYIYNQNVSDVGVLQKRVTDSSIAVACTHIDAISGSPGVVDVWFEDALSAPNQTTLDDILADQDVAGTKVTKKKAINNYRDYKMFVEYYTWPTDSNSYDVDEMSQFKMAATLAYINSGGTLPGDFKWRDAVNVDHDFTAQQYIDFIGDIWNRAEELHDVAKQHKDAVDALTTVAAVDAYDYTTEAPAWPA